MSAQRSQSSLRSTLTRIVYSGLAMEKMEQCDGCRRNERSLERPAGERRETSAERGGVRAARRRVRRGIVRQASRRQLLVRGQGLVAGAGGQGTVGKGRIARVIGDVLALILRVRPTAIGAGQSPRALTMLCSSSPAMRTTPGVGSKRTTRS